MTEVRKKNKFLEKIKIDVSCPICLDIVVDAATISCGHTFCSDCILTSRMTSGDFVSDKGRKVAKCPECRVYTACNIKKNIMLNTVLTTLGGKEYKRRVSDYQKESDNRKLLRKYSKTERFYTLRSLITQYIVKVESVEISTFLEHFNEYPEVELKYILHKNFLDTIVIYGSQIVFRHKHAICQFVEDNFDDMSSEDTIFFLNILNGGHLNDVLNTRYKFRSPTLIDLENYYETNKKKIIKRLSKVTDKDNKIKDKEGAKRTRKALAVKVSESIQQETENATDESYSSSCNCLSSSEESDSSLSSISALSSDSD